MHHLNSAFRQVRARHSRPRRGQRDYKRLLNGKTASWWGPKGEDVIGASAYGGDRSSQFFNCLSGGRAH